ncbi:methionine adenosyltransferase [Streptomyces sp. NPDC017940]|uniref:methionine adenosyltransferase n=1 Tax=Streptomyces sp. NPDC017940 TaxID=3365017 RepID=UPI0037A733CA
MPPAGQPPAPGHPGAFPAQRPRRPGEKDELYLTYTGSSIESGDEGVVGRGNRVNGLLTPLRPMNLEGANGKNPVCHVGKLYNIAAQRLAHRLHETTVGHAEVHLVSTTASVWTNPGASSSASPPRRRGRQGAGPRRRGAGRVPGPDG